MALKNECMEEKIKRVVSRTKMMFVYFWLLPVFLVAFGETGGEWVGVYAGDVRAAYFAETVTILLTAVLVPVSLKLFSWMLTKKIDVVAITGALRLYALWSGVRLALLAGHFVLVHIIEYLHSGRNDGCHT